MNVDFRAELRELIDRLPPDIRTVTINYTTADDARKAAYIQSITLRFKKAQAGEERRRRG